MTTRKTESVEFAPLEATVTQRPRRNAVSAQREKPRSLKEAATDQIVNHVGTSKCLNKILCWCDSYGSSCQDISFISLQTSLMRAIMYGSMHDKLPSGLNLHMPSYLNNEGIRLRPRRFPDLNSQEHFLLNLFCYLTYRPIIPTLPRLCTKRKYVMDFVRFVEFTD